MSPQVSLWSYGKGSYIIRAEILSSNPNVVKMSVIFDEGNSEYNQMS